MTKKERAIYESLLKRSVRLAGDRIEEAYMAEALNDCLELYVRHHTQAEAMTEELNLLRDTVSSLYNKMYDEYNAEVLKAEYKMKRLLIDMLPAGKLKESWEVTIADYEE